MLGLCKCGSNAFKTNGEPFEEVDCCQDLGSQVAADGGSEMDVVLSSGSTEQCAKQQRIWNKMRKSVYMNL